MVSPIVHERLVRAIREKRLIAFDYKSTTGASPSRTITA